jgi:4-hydroxybutyryl-CoA dehydratase/vinylacetyl-CoA-Delta-isomerase
LNRVVKETESVVEMWSRLVSINTENEYVETSRGRDVNSYRFGEWVEEPVGHPTILLSINAMKATDSLASSDPEWPPLGRSSSTPRSTAFCARRGLAGRDDEE